MAEMIGVYSNEKKYQQVKSKLKNIGKILLFALSFSRKRIPIQKIFTS